MRYKIFNHTGQLAGHMHGAYFLFGVDVCNKSWVQCEKKMTMTIKIKNRGNANVKCHTRSIDTSH
jgi:general stress protein 26